MSEDWDGVVAAHRDAAKQRIISAAIELTAERGIGGVSMTALAERAGVSRPTLYTHFSDVPSALLAWVTDAVDAAVAAVEARMATADAGAWDQLEAFVDSASATFDAEQCEVPAPDHIAAGLSPLLGETLKGQMERMRVVLEKVIRDGAASGELRDDLDPAVVAELVLHAISGLRGDVSRRDRSDAVRVALAMLRGGLEPRGRGAHHCSATAGTALPEQ